MDNTDHAIKHYTAQTETVINILNREGVCFSRKAYILRKYGESASIFVAAYSWFIQEAQYYVAKPQGAEYPYWAFRDLYSVEPSSGSRILPLYIPVDEAIFFDMYDWNKILCLQYIGDSEEETLQFRKRLVEYGIQRESDIMTTNFYPDLKRQIHHSWKKLFRHHEHIKAGNTSNVQSIQVGLWQLKKDWIAMEH